MRTTFTTAAATAVLAAALLTGCSGGAQSAADACKLADEQMSGVAADMQSTMSGLSAGDLDSAQKTFTALEDQLAKTTADISHPEVKAAMTDMSTSVSEFGDLIGEMTAAGGDQDKLAALTEALTEKMTALQEATATMGEVCGG